MKPPIGPIIFGLVCFAAFTQTILAKKSSSTAATSCLHCASCTAPNGTEAAALAESMVNALFDFIGDQDDNLASVKSDDIQWPNSRMACPKYGDSIATENLTMTGVSCTCLNLYFILSDSNGDDLASCQIHMEKEAFFDEYDNSTSEFRSITEADYKTRLGTYSAAKIEMDINKIKTVNQYGVAKVDSAVTCCDTSDCNGALKPTKVTGSSTCGPYDAGNLAQTREILQDILDNVCESMGSACSGTEITNIKSSEARARAKRNTPMAIGEFEITVVALATVSQADIATLYEAGVTAVKAERGGMTGWETTVTVVIQQGYTKSFTGKIEVTALALFAAVLCRYLQ